MEPIEINVTAYFENPLLYRRARLREDAWRLTGREVVHLGHRFTFRQFMDRVDAIEHELRSSDVE